MAAKLKVVESEASEVARPPRDLGKHGQAFWRKVQAEYAVEDAGGVELLAQACAALDRAESLRETIAKDGEIIRTKTGLRDHPALRHELANRAFVTRVIARLGLDVEPIRGVGRPAGGGYRGD